MPIQESSLPHILYSAGVRKTVRWHRNCTAIAVIVYLCVCVGLYSLASNPESWCGVLGVGCSIVPPPAHHTINKYTVEDGKLVVNGSHYNYWNHSKLINKTYLHKLESLHVNFLYLLQHVNTTTATYRPPPVAQLPDYLWAQNVTRSSIRHLSDIVVVANGVVADLEELQQAMLAQLGEHQQISFIVFDDLSTSHNLHLRSHNIHFLSRSSLHADWTKAAAQRAALIEIADVFLSLNGMDSHVGWATDTPTLLLFEESQPLQSPVANATQHPTIDQITSAILTAVRGCDNEVLFHSYLNPSMGYGSSAEQMALSLHNMQVQLAYHPFKSPLPPPNWKQLVQPATHEILSQRACGHRYLGYFVPHEEEVRSIHRLARKAKLSVLYTTFETTKVPSTWHQYVNAYDKLLCSCPEIKHAFENSGVTVPVEVVPLGVEASLWPMLERDWPPAVTRLLLFADGSWTNHRKNFKLVLDAFLEEFHADTAVQLLLKTTQPLDPKTAGEVGNHSNVKLLSGRFPQHEMLNLMQQAHVLVFPSHGEGFGLPPREAMATGMPVILAGFAGLEPISSPSLSFPLQWNWEPAIGYTAWLPQNLGSTDWGLWASVTRQELRRVMREAVSQPDEIRMRGIAAAKFIREHETYGHTGRTLIQSLELN